MAALEKSAGQTEAARAATAKAAQIDPGSTEAQLHRATDLMETGDLGEAEQALEKALDREPHDPDALSLLASLRISQRRLPDAETAARAALDSDSEAIEARYLLGFCRQHQGDHAQAIASYRTVLASLPKHAMSRYQLSWLLATAGDDALRNGSEALEMAKGLTGEAIPQKSVYHMALAACFAENGDFSAAQAALDTAESLAKEEKAHPAFYGRLRRQRDTYKAKRPLRLVAGKAEQSFRKFICIRIVNL
jgi:cytochrome c-type biogenesis protein CcmH/NrfG